MKKNIISLGIILVLTISPLISAQSYDFDYAKHQVGRVLDSALGIASPFFEAVIGDYATSEFFFHKILLLVLLIIISKNILDRTPIGEKNKKASMAIAIIISILSIRFINQNNFFEAIFIQYGVLGIAITTILPMVIFFYFIHNTKIGTYGRKVFWALYAITMSAIWISKSAEIPQIAHWIYWITIGAAIIFIGFDKSIHGYFGLTDFKKFQKKENKEAIYRAKERIQKLNERHDNNIISTWEWKQGIKEEEDRIKEISKET